MSVHEFPSSSTQSGKDQTGIQLQMLDDPIDSSLAHSSDPHRPNARAPPDQHPVVASSLEVQERAVPAEVRRRSPFINNLSSRGGVAIGKTPTSNGLRLHTPALSGSIETDLMHAQSQPCSRSAKQPPSAHSPIKVIVSGVVVSPREPSSPTNGAINSSINSAAYLDALIPGIQQELSVGPEIVIDKGSMRPICNEQQALADQPLKEVVSSSVIMSQLVERQPSAGSVDESDIPKQPAIIDATTNNTKVDKRDASYHQRSGPAVQKSGDETGRIDAGASKKDKQQQLVTLEPDTDSASRVFGRASRVRELAGNEGHEAPPLRDSISTHVQNKASRGHVPRSTPKKGAEIISIEETEDETWPRQTKPPTQKVVETRDIWSMPSDTDEKVKAKLNKKRNPTPSWGVTPGKPVLQRGVISSNGRSERKSTSSVENHPNVPRTAAEQQRSEPAKKERTNAARREGAAGGRAEKAEQNEEPKPSVAKKPRDSDQQPHESIQPASPKHNLETNTTKRGVTPRADATKIEKASGASVVGATKRENDVVSKKKDVSEPVPSLDRDRKDVKATKKKAASDNVASEDQGTKKARLTMVGEAKQIWAERKTTQEAEMAAREADAIAQMQRKVKTPLKKPTTKAINTPIAVTGTTHQSMRNLRDPSVIEGRTSATPSNRHDAARKGRSMTPLFPSSSTSKPTKSALRTSDSSIRRSVSFIDDAKALESPTLFTTKATRPVQDSQTSAALQGATEKGKSQQIERQSSPSNGTLKKRGTGVSSNSELCRQSSSKRATPSSDAGPKAMVQTKLTVNRDVKLKGREIHTPRSPRPVTLAESAEIVISSDSESSESTFYPEGGNRDRPTRAAPSSKKKLSSSMKAAGRAVSITPGSRSSPIIETNNVHKTKAESPTTASSSKASSDRDLRAMSISRSPAQYISRADSPRSQAASSIGPRTASESESETESESEDGSEAESGSDGDTQAPNHSRSALKNKPGSGRNESRHSIDTDIQDRDSISQSRTTSAPGSGTSEASGTVEEEEDLANQMEQQLQRDCRRSIEPPQLEKEPALPLATPAANKVALAQPTAIETSNKRFPSLSGLRSRATKDITNTLATQAPASTAVSSGTRARATLSSGGGHQRSHTSTPESDESSSSSDDSDEASIASQNRQGGNGMLAKGPSSTMKGISRIIRRTFMF